MYVWWWGGNLDKPTRGLKYPCTFRVKSKKSMKSISAVFSEKYFLLMMAAGECVKCGRTGHIGKDCRTGWKYEAGEEGDTPAVQVIEKKRKRETSGNHQSHNKRRQSNPPDGNVRITYIDDDTDSGKD